MLVKTVCRAFQATVSLCAFVSAAGLAQDIERIPAQEAQMQIKRSVPIAAEVAGTLVTVNPTEEGIFVKKDDVLVKLNDAVIRAEVERARKQAEMTTEIDFAEVALETALETQKQKTAANTRRAGTFSPSEMRQVGLEVKKGEAQLRKANDDVLLHQEDLKIKEAQLNQYTVLSPFDGFVTKVQKYPGQNVRPGDPVITLTDMSELRASLKVHYKYKEKLFVGDEVEIRIDTRGGSNAAAGQSDPQPGDDLGSIFGADSAEPAKPPATTEFRPAEADEAASGSDIVFIGKIDVIDPKVAPDSTQNLMITLGVTVPNKLDKYGRFMLQEGMPVKAFVLSKARAE
jgi:multidrug resistance efflux pump